MKLDQRGATGKRMRAGAGAPSFVLDVGSQAILSSSELRGRPLLLAFSDQWRTGSRDGLPAIRAELRRLDAALLVLTRSEAWSFRARDEVELLAGPCAQLERSIAVVVEDFALRRAGDRVTQAVFVIDDAGIVRFAHDEPAPSQLQGGILIALGAAGRAPSQKRRLALPQTRRDWVTSSLIAGLTLAFRDARGRAAAQTAAGPAAGARVMRGEEHLG